MSNILYLLTILSIMLTLGLYVALIKKAGLLTADRELLALKKPPHVDTMPLISIIIPARNESRNIGSCLKNLQELDYPAFEVLVADDHSTDDTAKIVQDFMANSSLNIRVLSPEEETPGEREDWVSGKAFVLWKAAQQAEGRWLLFLDADVFLHPDALWRAVVFAQNNQLQAFSGSGIYPNPGFWGEILEGVVYISVFLAIPLYKVNNSQETVGWMNGQFIMIDRTSYFQIEGHRGIRHCAQDDLAMGAYLKQKRVSYRFLPAAQLYECINYINLPEAFRGWARLLAAGTPWIGIGPGYFMASMLILFLTGIYAILVLPVGVVTAQWLLTSLLLFQLFLAILLNALNRASMKLPLWRALLTPLGALLALGVYLQGYRLRFGRGSYELRGRTFKPDQGL